MSAHDPKALEATDLLRFYAEAGVDVALSEEPVDRFALSRAIAEEAARKREAARRPREEREPPAAIE